MFILKHFKYKGLQNCTKIAEVRLQESHNRSIKSSPSWIVNKTSILSPIPLSIYPSLKCLIKNAHELSLKWQDKENKSRYTNYKFKINQ